MFDFKFPESLDSMIRRGIPRRIAEFLYIAFSTDNEKAVHQLADLLDRDQMYRERIVADIGRLLENDKVSRYEWNVMTSNFGGPKTDADVTRLLEELARDIDFGRFRDWL